MSKSPIETMLDEVEWKPIPGAEKVDPGDIPVATMEGILQIGDFSFRCFQLSDGRRILDARDIANFFGC